MAWTAPRTWADGELVTASIMNTHVRDNLNMIQSFCKIKGADETVNNSAVLQNDDDFSFTVLANEKWAVQVAIKLDTTTTADWKFTWTVPASTTFNSTYTYGSPVAVVDWTGSTASIVAATSAAQAVLISAYFLVSSTAGTVQFQWAQDTATGVNTIVKAGSFMVANRAQ